MDENKKNIVIYVVVIVVILLIMFAVWWLWKKRYHSKKHIEEDCDTKLENLSARLTNTISHSEKRNMVNNFKTNYPNCAYLIELNKEHYNL